MKSDLTRLTFNQAKHYRAVQQQQGRVQLDADWNEQLDITGHRIETETIDSVGQCGAPLHADGFRLIATASSLTTDEAARAGNRNPPPVPAGDLLLTAGRVYAGGVLVENDTITLVSVQPDLPTAAQLAKLGTLGAATTLPPLAPGTYLAYLDVWPRLRTALDDPRIREVALGGPDTATRIKNAWQVKFLPAAAGDNCASINKSWEALLHPKLGTLAASVSTTASKSGPCIVEPGSGYRRLENQLYRVEVHSGGDTLAKTSFKWSRDNGSIVTRWIGKQPLSDELEVESTGRDKVLAIAPGHWVELSDDTREELGLPGTFALVTKVSGNIISIDSANATGPVEIASFPKNPKVRRWDSAPAKPGKWVAPDGEKSLNSVDKFELEDGVVVEFGLGAFRTGDYWLIPARTALPFVEWPTAGGTPRPLPPQGVEHHYGKLAIVSLAAGVFTISDCRTIFPPLTELTSLHYVSGDSQEATPDPTKPASALLPLALPLQVGVANGEWPIAGARVRFRLQPGTGDGTLDPADGIVFTDGDGIASCRWSIDSTSANQEIVAELLDDADARVHLPIRFHARLNTAALVAYNPATCEGMKGAATAVITVQDAIDFLCRDRASTDCCVTIGGIGDRPGDYGTVAEAIKDLLQKRRHASICLSLLPGDHPIEELLVTPGEGATLTHVRITGCSQASRLLVRGPLRFQNLAEVVIRDLSMRSETAEAPVVMYERCREVEINNCRLQGRAPAMALISVAEVQRFRLISSLINAAGNAGDSDPSKVFKTAIPLLAKVFQQLEDRDFDAESALAADALAKLSPRERGTMAKSLNEAVENAKANLTDDELGAYTDFVKALRRNDPPPQGLFQQLSAIRAADAAATTPAGKALTLLDVAADSVLVDNRIKGIISLGGPPAGKALNQDERQKLADLIKRGAVEITASSGKLQLRGNHLMQIAVGDRMLEALRNLINQGNGSLPVWGSAHYSDNVIELGDNVFLARHLSLNTTRFLETATDLGTAVSHSGVFLGNSADQDVRLFCLGISALAANQGLNIVQL